MMGDKMADRIAAAKEIIRRGTCFGDGVQCKDGNIEGFFPCPNRCRLTNLKGWDCCDEAESAQKWLSKTLRRQAVK